MTRILTALPALLLAACATDDGYEPAAYEDDAFEAAGAPDARTAQAAYEALARVNADEALLDAAAGSMADAMAPLFEPMLEQAGVTDPAQKRLFTELFATELTAAMQPHMFDLALGLIKQNVDPANAIEVATFFETQAGRDYVAALPTLMRESATAGARLGEELAPAVVGSIATKLEAGTTPMDPAAAAKIAVMLRGAAPQ